MAAREPVEYELLIAAPPRTVFAYFTDGERMTRWMGMRATLDPRPGGTARIDVAEGATMVGEFVEVEPFERIVLAWGWEQEQLRVPPRSSSVEVSLAPDGDGTRLRLVHRRLPPDAYDFHRAGWSHFLGRLREEAA
ncbi:MAG TPA: SRPBCC family protein [Solirubrobacteraceae bacterium]|nr:SRPBCC family protein [Solirubrobacteraceae bacterium]